MRIVFACLLVLAITGMGASQVAVTNPVIPVPAWDDLVSVAGAINPIGSAGQMTVDLSETAYIGCLEANAANETAVIQFQLSHSTKDNTDIHPHIHWLVTGADVTGSAVFEANFRRCPVSGICTAWSGWSDGAVEVEPADSDGATGLTEWELADSTYNFNISDVILMQIRLKSLTVTTTRVCSADIHYQKDGLGSINELSR